MIRCPCVRTTLMLLTAATATLGAEPRDPRRVSGIDPRLAMFNNEGECGVGAVVPWAGRLWVVTYSPDKPRGSDDKLYEIDPSFHRVIRPESIGGTPANRMIHRESEQLFIGPYVIDREGKVRVIPYTVMLGRHTANARHLTDPQRKVYFFTMEEGLYEVDVKTLEVTTLFPDTQSPEGRSYLPGYHGKGGYSGQGRLVVSNNGQNDNRDYRGQLFGRSGCLAEWDGKAWSVIDEHQYCEVTGPGGLHGNARSNDPIWATGWDHRSVILKLLDGGTWHTVRLPKASYTYDARHGWYTEWPRIREIADGRYLMTMHGMFWDFPGGFREKSTGGLRPLSSYLKIVGDFCRWGDWIVVGCDDASKLQNPLLGQSQSNLWFLTPEQLRSFGPRAGRGGPWVHDDVRAGVPSDPFLVGGFGGGVVHVSHGEESGIRFTLELDRKGDGTWERWTSIEVPAKGYAWERIPADLDAEWLRVVADRDATDATAFLHLGDLSQPQADLRPYESLARMGSKEPSTLGVIRPRGAGLGTLHLAAQRVSKDGKLEEVGYYEIDADLALRRVEDPTAHAWLQEKARIQGPDVQTDPASIVLRDHRNRVFRLPYARPGLESEGPEGPARGIREVATERSLLNAGGSFYELPRSDAGGVARLKPVCTHGRRIHDFCSWRGLLVLTGLRAGCQPDEHTAVSDDGNAALWLGAVDDLWKLGKPIGTGGPWAQSDVRANEPSDPYLMAGYDRKSASLSHDSDEPVHIRLEVDVTADGTWLPYRTFDVPAGETVRHAFPEGYSAHWIRAVADRDSQATVQFLYE